MDQICRGIVNKCDINFSRLNSTLPEPCGVIRLVEMAQRHLTGEVHAAYGALEARASDCTKCGACKERCPFGVDVTAKMEQAVAVFG
jgi:predicted aldo/keto reductase-like oxidoreductase